MKPVYILLGFLAIIAIAWYFIGVYNQPGTTSVYNKSINFNA